MADDATDGRLDDVLRTLADRVRELRNQRGLSIAALAFEAGISQSCVRAIETGRTTASLPTLVALAETFGIEVSDLFGHEPASPPAQESHHSPSLVPSEVVWGGELPLAPWKAAPEPAADSEASPHVVPSEVVWGGELPPAPWTSDRTAPHTPAPAAGTASETAAAAGAWVTLSSIGTGELPPAPWMPIAPPTAPGSAPAPVVETLRSHVSDARGPAYRAQTPAFHEASTAGVFAPPAPGPREPRTFADLREGVLNGRSFGSLREFAVAAVVEGQFPLGAVARVFRLPAWRLEQWVSEAGHSAR